MEKNLNDKSQKSDSNKPETAESLKKESTKSNPEQKGYNEHNPSQSSGAFTPDSKTAEKE